MLEVISYRQSVFLLSMILPVTGHFLLLPTIFSFSGHEAWVAILLAAPLSFLFGFILYRLHTIFPNYTFNDMLTQTFGKIAGNFLNIGLLCYFFYLMLITFYGMIDFIQVIFLPETPRFVIAIPFFLVVLYASYSGIESIARISEALLPIIIFTGSTIGIATIPEKNYKLLLPVFENGLISLTSSIVLTIALYGETLLLLMIHIKKDHAKSRSLMFTNTLLMVLITFMFLGTVTGTISVFGEKLVQTLEYPAQSIVRLVSFGFIERFDIYGIAVIVLGSVIRASVLLISIYQIFRKWVSSEKAKWPIQLAIIIAIVFFSFAVIDSHRHFISIYITNYYPLTAVISFGLPLITWIVSEFKRIAKPLKL
ncbi:MULTISPECIES: GerAB/ArcD/ProY family transporter [Mesobacillus]|uniref:Uncharacterized protein n=2 Tax=Mesobacillus TaxID=2675231 RepID=A0A0D6Z8R1_9BACI|nr:MULTISPECIES: endospore germination permease [Mesobacillus]KIY20968.1 hypothetical protein UB32_16280 [Mesobacillus subterraneus]MDQ0413448.1 spore germination protein (amino acid permease) [Mesobacillus stamsii]